MIKLYGAPISNYYNMVKVALIEKGIDFEEILTPPSQDPAYLNQSPMGKIPCIETRDGFLSESLPILEYLESLESDAPLLPLDAFAQAKAREISQVIELNVELVARRGLGGLRGKPVADLTISEMQRDLPKGCAAVARLTQFGPFICGETFTYADIVSFFSLILANRIAIAVADTDLMALIPGAQAWFEMMQSRPSVARALADQKN
ncbi:MAG: glutathione S-transferase family protein [Pseudomonadales bacterium]|nr:glutathione S-transferase family protein [Pseudomonadales bacterium]